MSFFQNACKPERLGGKIMVAMMNMGHASLAAWGFQHISIPKNGSALDVGCGGGANLKKLLSKCPRGIVKGIDYSAVSDETSRKVNAKDIQAGRCEVLQASVTELPFEDASFDLVTAFETIYFWPGLADCFREVYRVTKPGGTFFICYESTGEKQEDEKWTSMIEGMTIYNVPQILTALEQAGFSNVKIEKNEKGWICMTAEK